MAKSTNKQGNKQSAPKKENKPARAMKPQIATRSKTLSNGQQRPKKRG